MKLYVVLARFIPLFFAQLNFLSALIPRFNDVMTQRVKTVGGGEIIMLESLRVPSHHILHTNLCMENNTLDKMMNTVLELNSFYQFKFYGIF